MPNPQARALALGRNFLIGLVYDNPNAQMILSMQRGVLEALHGTEFELVIRPVDRGSNQVMDDIRGFVSRQRLFGVVILPPMSENDALARMLDEEGCRYVRMGSAVLDDPEHMVASNDRESGGRGGALSHRARASADRTDRRTARVSVGQGTAGMALNWRWPKRGSAYRAA